MHSSTDQGLDSEDFQEAPSVARSKGYHPILIGVGGALIGLILAIVLIRGSMPELTPEQIVAMDGYEGRQPPRYIFNLDSLETVNRGTSGISQNSAIETETARPSKRVLSEQVLKEQALREQSQQQVLQNPVLKEQLVASADSVSDSAVTNINALAIKTEEPKDSWPLEIVEVAAAPIIVGKDALEVAAPIVEEFDYRKLNRKNVNGLKASDAAITTLTPTDTSDVTGSPGTIRVLPVLTVNTDQTYIHAEPSQTADVKMVLARGMSVTAFEKTGAWVYVGANDGSSITGYVHQSTIAATEIN